MIKNILFLLGALIFTIASWGVYQIIGDYLFLIILVVAFLLLMDIEALKYGSKNKK
jgi:uncharacterized membrane protein YhaH (DUF805 family)